jgi:hypothetical protein
MVWPCQELSAVKYTCSLMQINIIEARDRENIHDCVIQNDLSRHFAYDLKAANAKENKTPTSPGDLASESSSIYKHMAETCRWTTSI